MATWLLPLCAWCPGSVPGPHACWVGALPLSHPQASWPRVLICQVIVLPAMWGGVDTRASIQHICMSAHVLTHSTHCPQLID